MEYIPRLAYQKQNFDGQRPRLLGHTKWRQVRQLEGEHLCNGQRIIVGDMLDCTDEGNFNTGLVSIYSAKGMVDGGGVLKAMTILNYEDMPKAE